MWRHEGIVDERNSSCSNNTWPSNRIDVHTRNPDTREARVMYSGLPAPTPLYIQYTRDEENLLPLQYDYLYNIELAGYRVL